MENTLSDWQGFDAHQYANPWFVATVSALTFVYVLTLFL